MKRGGLNLAELGGSAQGWMERGSAGTLVHDKECLPELVRVWESW
jgi:hypothetical protein